MLRVVFQRRFGKGSLIALTLLLVVLAGTVGAVRPLNVFAASTDTCGYNPLAAPAPGGGTVIFDENTVTRAIQFYGVGLGGHVGVFANDESGLYIGSGGTPSSHVSGQVYGEAVPPTFGTGSDAASRPSAPTIYLTDITSNASATGGDWENGGQAATTGATGLYGSWSPTIGTKPVNKNDWTLGPNADPIPATDAFGGTTTSFNEHYSAEVTWNVPGLKAYDPATSSFVAVQPGHTYRVQSLTHDTDQNHTSGGGDVGEVCTTFSIPVAKLTITKTADVSPVNAGDTVGFTVEIKNTGTADATSASLNDPLPAGSGAGVTWAVDGSTGTPAKFVLSGAKGSQTLGLASSTIPVGADYTIHITASTSASECGVYDNTATLTTTNANNPNPASAEEVCKPAHVTITKTADASPVNAGDPIGFTVEVKNTGTGVAKGVNLADPLPGGSGSGVTWTVDSSIGTPAKFVLAGSQGSQTLTLASGTLPAGADYTIHITASTSASECGVYDNTATLTTTNSNNPNPASAEEVCNTASIQIDKTADALKVNQGQQIGFTVTVYNSGSGDAKGVKLNDPLPADAGLSWTIEKQGTGWGGTCAIAAGALKCGPATVPAGTTELASTFTVHIISPTDTFAGGLCPDTGVVSNTGFVTTTNDGSGNDTATTCVEGVTDLQITKTGAPATQDVPFNGTYQDITWTMVVKNNGPDVDTNVVVGDPIPAGTTYVSHTTTAGTCTLDVPTSTLNCSLGTMQVGDTVTITLVTTPAPTDEGQLTNTAEVSGSMPESDTTNNQATATVLVVREHQPPVYCTGVIVTPKQLYAGRSSKVHLTVINHHHRVQGVRVRITGPGLGITTKPSDAKGKISRTIKPKKAGIVTFKPLVSKASGGSCKTPRIGITGVFTPPVTG